MAVFKTPERLTGSIAPDFELLGIDGRFYTLADVKGPKGVVIMFICNHCPYVKAVADRLVADAADLRKAGVGMAAVMSNDARSYPEDSFENMQIFARDKGFTFPYLVDESQEVAKAYGAVCTPDIFGYNAALELQYRGRLDASWNLAVPEPRREMLLAMQEIAEKSRTETPQYPSIGCSIKWKNLN